MREMHKSLEKECLHCKVKIRVYVSDIKRGGGKYCSPSCSGKHSIEIRRKKLEGSPSERFFNNIIKSDDDKGCWIWVGLASKQGYGRMTIKKKQKLAHRYSWEFHFGEIPEKMFICHKCDNPPCVNPAHLFVGNRSDNAKDMVSKNRNRDDRGSNHPMAKLNEEKVIKIRERINSGEVQKDLAKEYNVSPMTISMIKRRINWNNI
jgi:hypothetical protein